MVLEAESLGDVLLLPVAPQTASRARSEVDVQRGPTEHFLSIAICCQPMQRHRLYCFATNTQTPKIVSGIAQQHTHVSRNGNCVH